MGARELVGPIIAMTITLAAVYAPIGLQGGLTGSLFREFAFTLAGAVFISGVVALTLSPMMSSQLLDAGHEEHGLTGRINRDFDRFSAFYGRLLDAHPGRPPGRLPRLDRPEPAGDPDVHDGAQGAGPDRGPGRHLRHHRRAGRRDASTRPRRFTDAVNQAYFERSRRRSSAFQITFPSYGLRRHGAQALGRAQAHHLQHPAGGAGRRCASIPGIRTLPVLPPALPGGGQFPVEFVIASTAEPEEILQFARRAPAEGRCKAACSPSRRSSTSRSTSRSPRS